MAARHPELAANLVPHRSRRETVLTATRFLRRRPRPADLNRLRGERVLLVIDKHVPTPDRDSGSVRMAALVDLSASLGLRVVFAPATRVAPEPYASRLEARGVTVLEGPSAIEHAVDTIADDLVGAVLSRQPVAEAYLPAIRERAPGTKVVYDTVDLIWRRTERHAEVRPSRSLDRWAARARTADAELVRRADATIAITGEEAADLGALAPGSAIYIVPNIHELPDAAAGSPPAGTSLLFVGNFRHAPNTDAVVWFVEEVLPLIRMRVPDVTVDVVGAAAPPSVAALASGCVRVRGWVPDLTEAYRSARVVVAPLRYGAGMKGKVGEALSFGVPVVTTPVGAEGFGSHDAAPMAVATDPQAFAAAVAELCSDDDRWRDLARRGRSYVEANLSRAAVERRVKEMFGELGITSR